MLFRFSFFCVVCFLGHFGLLAQTPIKKMVEAHKFAVSSAHPEASKVGFEVLKKGGNAVDASIAVQLALAVVYPRAGNIGGGGFMVLRKKNGTVLTLDYREKAPQTATKDMYLDANGEVVGMLSRHGHLAAGVPGTVDGLFEAHKQAGKLPFAQLISPAIQLAEKGFILTEKDAAVLNKHQDDIKKFSLKNTALYRAEGWKIGDTLIQKDLAETLKRIKAKGRAGFYEGVTAELIVKDMQAGKGIISLLDLKNYKTQIRKPIRFKYRDYDLVSMGPPSSGGTCLAMLLNMTERFDLSKIKCQSKEAVNLMVEAQRRVYADRATHLGDPDFWKVPPFLLSKKYAKARIKNFEFGKITPSLNIAAGTQQESEQTTHLSVVDAQGNAVAVTTTLNSNFGSKVVVSEAGFLLNNEMDDFSAKPGVPNQYGLLGSLANAIAPNKRMLSAMTPTIVSKNGKLVMVVGTPGGATIITSVYQVILNVLDFKLSLQEAVNLPRFHSQWLPDKIFIEPTTFTPEQRNELSQMGYTLEEREPIGLVDAIYVNPKGKIFAVGDSRGDDTAMGE